MPFNSSHTNLPGRLVAVEGLDGSGKSTQIYLVKRWLELEGYRVFFTEWNSSILVKKSTTKGKKRQLLTPTTFSLLPVASMVTASGATSTTLARNSWTVSSTCPRLSVSARTCVSPDIDRRR